MVTGGSFLGIRWPGREVATTVEVKNSVHITY